VGIKYKYIEFPDIFAYHPDPVPAEPRHVHCCEWCARRWGSFQDQASYERLSSGGTDEAASRGLGTWLLVNSRYPSSSRTHIIIVVVVVVAPSSLSPTKFMCPRMLHIYVCIYLFIFMSFTPRSGMIKQLYALTCTLNGESGIAIAPLPAKILTKDSTNAPSSAPAQSPVVVVPVARAPASMAAEKSNLTTTTAGARVSQTLNLNARDRSPTVIGSADDPRNPYVGSAPQHLQRQREQQEQLTQHQSRAVVGGGNLQDTKGYVSVVSSSFPSAVTNPVAEMGSPQRRLNHAPPMTQVRRTEPHGSTGSVGSFLSFLPVRTKKWGDGGQGLPMKVRAMIVK